MAPYDLVPEPPEVSEQEQLQRDYMNALKGLATANSLQATALASEMDITIDSIRGQLASIRQRMIDAGMDVPSELSLRGLGRG